MSFAYKIRPILRYGWVCLLQVTGCLEWAERQLRRRDATAVLTFHRVLDDGELRQTCSLAGIVVRRRTFEELAAHVAAKYEAVDCGHISAGGGRLRVAFTFDDGWRDNVANAVPMARKHRIPLTIFICPGLIGKTSPFWPERVSALLRHGSSGASPSEIERVIETLKTYTPVRREQFIAGLGKAGVAPNPADQLASWDEIREMDAAGVRIGCHTLTHQILAMVPVETARREIREAKRAIEDVLHKPCDMFAYPNGNHSRAVRQLLAEEGFGAAFTTEPGARTDESDPLAIPRINIYEAKIVDLAGHFSPAMFRYTVFWKAWRAMRKQRHTAAALRPEFARS